MSYSNFVKDPVLVAVVSALLGLALAFLYDKWKYSNDRRSSLRLLKHQLENQDRQLGVLNENLGKNRVLGGLDTFYISSFINGSAVDIAKDESLILFLYQHLDNVELIHNSLQRINLYSAGFTTVQSGNKDELEENLKGAIRDCQKTVQDCVSKLAKL